MAEGRETNRTIERKFEQPKQFELTSIENSKVEISTESSCINNKMIESRKNLIFVFFE